MMFFRGADYEGLEEELNDISDAKRVKQKELDIVSTDNEEKTPAILQVNVIGLSFLLISRWIYVYFKSVSNIMSKKFLRPFSCIGVIYIVYQGRNSIQSW